MSLIKKLQLTYFNNDIQEGFNGKEGGRGNRLVTKNKEDIKIKTIFHHMFDIYKAPYQ